MTHKDLVDSLYAIDVGQTYFWVVPLRTTYVVTKLDGFQNFGV
jgi:hypothetical protein